MVYYKRRVTKRKPAASRGNLATKTYVKKIIKAKKARKVNVVNQSGGFLQYTVPTVADLTDPGAGDTEEARNGTIVAHDGIDFRYTLYSGTADAVARLMLVQINDNTQLADFTDIGFGVNNYLAFQIPDPSSDGGTPEFMKVLYDSGPMGMNALADNAHKYTLARHVIIPASKFPRKRCFFDEGATSGRNHVWLIAGSTIATGSTGPNLQFSSHAYFREY